jgi:hypothetical protein
VWTRPRASARPGDDVVDQQVLTPGAAFLEHLAHGDARPGGPQAHHRTEPFGLGCLRAVRGTHVEWTIPVLFVVVSFAQTHPNPSSGSLSEDW